MAEGRYGLAVATELENHWLDSEAKTASEVIVVVFPSQSYMLSHRKQRDAEIHRLRCEF